MTLAKRYVFEGCDRTEICAYNSGVKPNPWKKSHERMWPQIVS